MQWLLDMVIEYLTAQGYLTSYFVDRGDPAVVDFDTPDLTYDGTWKDLDLSGIVPPEATGVAIISDHVSLFVGLRLDLRQKGNVNSANLSRVATQTSNIIIHEDHVCPIGPDGMLEYRGENFAWAVKRMTVKGWWL